MTAGDVWRSFGRWRHRRPFWGCFFFLLSGVELFFTANQSLGGISLHLGPTGFLSYVLPLIMVICGVLCLITPAQRLFYGIVGLLAALYSFIGLNLGGFFLGMLFGIVGGALVIAWGPPRVKPADPVNPDFVPIADQLEEPASADDYSADDATDADAETENVEIAGHDDRSAEERVRPAAAQEPGIVPGFEHDQEGSKSSRLSRNPKALTVALIVIGLTAGLLAVGSRVPARADDTCPAGLPSRSATSTSTSTSTTAAAAKAAAGAARTAAGTATSAAGAAKKEPPKTSTPAAPGASPGKSGSGNSIVDGVTGIIDGVGNLLGLGDDPSSSPSASPSPSQTPTTAEPTKTGDPDPTGTAGPTRTGTATATATGSAEPTKAASASAGSDDVIPCLGSRVFGRNAGADDVPPVADQPGLLETDSLTMYDPTYDGVVNLKTGSGNTVRVLKFSMSKSVNKPFSLTIAGPDSSQTVITSNELATIGTVKFYTQRFEGKLFGVIPVVFTPDQPPPLTLPILWFTDAKIQLNYVRCDTLTGVPLHISQKG